MTRVIKLGGRVQRDPALLDALAAAWHASPGSFCIVHGGGEEISELQRRLGAEPKWSGGRRITTAEDVEIVRMALSGAANKRLVASLVARGVSALGLSGEDARLIVARPLDGDRLGQVGEPALVDAAVLLHLLAGGLLPVIAPLSSCAGPPHVLNVNGDDAAAAIAVVLGAEELLFVSDVPAVIDDGSAVAALDDVEALALIAAGSAKGGMAAKLEAAAGALRGGVARVRIGGVEAIYAADCGTVMMAAASLA